MTADTEQTDTPKPSTTFPHHCPQPTAAQLALREAAAAETARVYSRTCREDRP